MVLIQWLVVYLLISPIYWINHYRRPLDNSIIFGSAFPLVSDLSSGRHDLTLEQLEPFACLCTPVCNGNLRCIFFVTRLEMWRLLLPWQPSVCGQGYWHGSSSEMASAGVFDMSSFFNCFWRIWFRGVVVWSSQLWVHSLQGRSERRRGFQPSK